MATLPSSRCSRYGAVRRIPLVARFVAVVKETVLKLSLESHIVAIRRSRYSCKPRTLIPDGKVMEEWSGRVVSPLAPQQARLAPPRESLQVLSQLALALQKQVF